jgi:OmcA/MtrC family decaheme c-type cytochrome
MKSLLVRLGLTALMIGALAGCGGSGSTGATGATGAPGAPGATGASGVNAVATSNGKILSATDWQALVPAISGVSVTITQGASGVPGSVVAKFKVTDQNGLPVTGLSGQSVAQAGALPSNFDISFTLAKLIPAANGEPSRWVNYGVVSPLSKTTPAAVSAATSSVAATSPTAGTIQWIGSVPSPDSNGTLVETINGVAQPAGTPGDGGYQYTFLRDITQTQAIVQALALTGFEGSLSGNNATNGATTNKGVYKTADLDPANLNYVASATHRLGIYISGSQPGTGTATANGVQSINPVPLVQTANIGFDFVPNGSKPAVTRNIVEASSCDGCHDNVKFKRGIGHVNYNMAGTAASKAGPSGLPPGAAVGRNDPRLCVTCHTDQAKFGFPDVVAGTNADGSPNYGASPAFNSTDPYYREVSANVPTTQQASYIYPRLIHKTHMGNQLVITGYDENAHCSGNSIATNVGQCFNNLGFPQDQRDCTKCHDGSADTANGTTDSANWKMVPNIAACGACHDGINFATGAGSTLADRDAAIANSKAVGTYGASNGALTNHGGGAQTTNANCVTCHVPGGASLIPTYHTTIYKTPNSPTAAEFSNHVSSATDTITFAIKPSGVSVNGAGNVQIAFSMLVNGKQVTQLPQLTVANGGLVTTNGVVGVSPSFPTLTGLIGGPSFYVAYAVPQDGITAPADFNAYSSVPLVNLLIATGTSPSQGTLDAVKNPVSGGYYQADSSGYFYATLTGDTVGQPVTGTCLQPTSKVTTSTTTTLPAALTQSTVNSNTGMCVAQSPIVIPGNATMVTAMIRGGFTETDVAAFPFLNAADSSAGFDAVGHGGGIHITVPIVMQANSAGTGTCTAVTNTAGSSCRRAVTSATLCNNCHEFLGSGVTLAVSAANAITQTQSLFHSTDSNDPNACPVCHNVNQVDGAGFSANLSTWVHGIHGATKRTVNYTPHNDFSTVQYPGLLKDCSQCHLPNTVNFGTTGGYNGGTTFTSSLLWSTEAKGVMTPTANQPAVVNPQSLGNPNTALGTISNAPAAWGVVLGNNYGPAFSYTPAGANISPYANQLGVVQAAATAGAGGTTILADPATLVSSPIAAACSACHTDSTSIGHIQTNGGVFYGTRGTKLAPNINAANVLSNPEGCLACHGQGTIMDAAVVHNTN